MFRELIRFFESCFNVLFQTMYGYFQLAYAQYLALTTAFTCLFSAWFWGVDFLNTKLTWLTYWVQSQYQVSYEIGNEVYPTWFTLVPDVIRMCNTVYPMTDTFLIVSVILGVRVFCSLYGLVKSWVPTVSG